ncbi:carbon-nitrogen hydrolase family protein [Erwinia sp. 198]|uniref:carbon-nitrogen hydrolase family protein n=1 Tax=Erwinia sp. 198 TaxID=2022746 RepID=UPI000F68A40C|nr:carbon-nitrogen hydrolase family protein [Erwinia sp. 198]RRZ95843.1 carbon-nitrogen hydrolase family protein [Erwinia sp. 198]
MSVWSIAAAQSGSRPGEIEWNIERHLAFVRQAAEHQVDLLLFPELSITGYELALASQLAMSIDDVRLNAFAEAATEYRMSIVTGVPLQDGDKIRLCALAFLPDGTRLAYFKRNLIEAEKPFFHPGQSVPVFGYQHHHVAMAVCADISVEDYARDAAHRGANLYATSVLLSEKGYHKDCEYLARWSRKFNIAVLMANHALPTGGFDSAGQSAVWDENGQQVIAGGRGEQLVIARRQDSKWQGEVHDLRTATAP